MLRRVASFVLAGLLGAAAPADARDVRVGVYANPPKLQLGADGQPSGIFGDLLAEVAREEGWRLLAVPCEWEGCIDLLRAGRIDLMPDVAWTEARAAEFSLHDTPALTSWSQLYRRGDVDLEAVTDIGGMRIAVLEGSVQQDYLATLAAGLGLEVEWLPAASLDAALDAVAEGRADAIATNHHFGDWVAMRRGLRATPVIFMPARLYYAGPPGRGGDLLARIEHHLVRWQARSDSRYYDVLARWGAPPEAATLPAHWRWAAAGAFGLLLAALGVVALMRREVARKTRSLRASEERLATILNSVDAHIFIKDAALRYAYVNQKVCDLLGLPSAQVLGRGDEDFFDAATAAVLRGNDLKVIEGGERIALEETKRLRSGGEPRTFLSVKLPLRDAVGEVTSLCAISTDITEQHLLLSEIHQLAWFDPLTHLPNRQQLLDRLRDSLAACAGGGRQGALLVVNLDRFQALNDTRGHDVGDRWLQVVAQRIPPCLHEGEWAARMGADEFGFLIAQLPLAAQDAQRQAAALAQRLLDAIAQPGILDDVPYHGTASVGIALFADPQETVEDVLKHADIALSQAKVAGGHRMRFFQPEMQTAIAARAALEADLRAGIDAGQLLLHYQPQVDLHGRLIGVEALARWAHPQRGLLLPGSFIALAEASGLILPLGRAVLRTACAQLARWADDPGTAGLRIAVNVSAAQLHQPDFVDEVLGICRASGAPPARLELEITESQLVEDVEESIAKLAALRAEGVRVALDDFGTGYSALGYVKRLPLDLLKIDTTFTRDLLFDPNDIAIVRTIIALGRSLGLEVLAEGVEETAQRDILSELGCEQFQGWLFGRPAGIEALAGWLAPAAREIAPQA